MKCSNCQAINPDEARFCENCGNPLELACPNCGKPVMPVAKFCRNCGYRLSPTEADSAAAPVSSASAAPRSAVAPRVGARAMPQAYRARRESVRAERSMQGERRVVTVLFCDVKGSTAMAEKLDPEDWAEIMNQAFESLIQSVYRYEGTVARLMGDAILAFFGAPIAHEDDPQRAVLAGLGIVAEIAGFREQMERERGLDFNVRVGINTGLVVVGEVGSDLRVEYTAMGDAVNVAARMEQTARAGTVQIAENTFRTIAPLFDFEPLGGIEVKGKAEPVLAYRVLRPKAMPGRTRGIAGLDSPLVGREAEVGAMQRAIRALQTGQGGIISIMGEAGLGKSRLLSESSHWALPTDTQPAVGKPLQWFEGHSVSYDTAKAYAPFVSLFTGWLGLRPEDSGETRYAAVKTAIAALDTQQAERLAPFIATLLGIGFAGEDFQRVKYMEPPQLRESIFQAVVGLCELAASAQPLVLVWEDLHWADVTSLELLERLMPLTARLPLLLIALYRAQPGEDSWRFHQSAERDFSERYTAITLAPLDEAHSRELVANLLQIEDLPESVRALILRKSEGNPFFVEEVIRSLLDSKLVVREGEHWRATREIVNIALPDTLGGVILARLDRLDDAGKHAAQTAAVIGREFGYQLLCDVGDEPLALDGALVTLQERELVREKNPAPTRILLFKHALTQETAYASLLLSRRRELHRRVAETLERSSPEHVNDLARHWQEAREPVRALPYLVASGDAAARAYATPDAIGYYSRAIDILKTNPDLALARRAYEGLGNALSFANEFARAVETYEQMLELARQNDDIVMQVSALNKLAFVVGLRLGQFPDAERVLADAEKLARTYEDKHGLSEMSTIRCMMCTAAADFDGVLRYMGEAISLGRELNVKEQLALGLSHIANTQMFMTRFAESAQTAKEALHLAREIGDRQREAEVIGMAIALSKMGTGSLDEAQYAAAQGRNIASQIGAVFPLIITGWVLAEIARLRGDYAQAIAQYERSLQFAKPMEQVMAFLMIQPLASLGSTYVELGGSYAARGYELHSEALRLLDTPSGLSAGGTAWADIGFSALAGGNLELASTLFRKALQVPTMFQLYMRPRHLLGLALVALAQEHFEETDLKLGEARSYAEARGMRHFYPQIDLAESQMAAAQGEHTRALAACDRALATAQELGLRPALLTAHTGAAEALASLGRDADAAARRASARAIADDIAASIDDPALRAEYLAKHAIGPS